MKPLQLKLILIMMLFAFASSLLAYTGFSMFSGIKFYEKNIHLALEARSLLENLSDQKISDILIKNLQEIRAEITPEKRQSSFSDIIQAYTSGNRSLLKRRIQIFLENDRVYVNNFLKEIEYLEKRLYFYSVALFASIFLILLGMAFYINSQIFIPIKNTTLRMNDFLNGKYSYSFDTPEDDEMGELQSTFNLMAQEVLRNMEELKSLDAAKSDFLNIASHELRTPMTSIKGSLGLISEGVMGKIPDDILNLICIAETETDRLIRLINDILDMAKIDAKKLPLKQEWSSLDDIIDKTASSLQGLAQSFNVQIKKGNSFSFLVFCDADRIQQVITNLVSNAIKFSPSGGTVDILVEAKENEAIKIMVRDHGKGMTPQEKSILFQKFRQISSPDNPLVKGTGLGLAIAKALIEEHDGKIDVTTKPGEGSTFFFTLPKWQPEYDNTRMAA